MSETPYQVKWFPSINRRGKMKMMNNQDFAFSHKINAFSRFEFFPQMLLFTEIKNTPDSAIISSLRHFVHRFPTFIIAIYQEPFLWCASKRKEISLPMQQEFESKEKALEWIKQIAEENIEERMSFCVDWNDKFYETFFDSQFIQSRKNIAVQKQLMPMFFLDKDTPEYRSMKMYKRTLPNTTLKQF